jgi:hypothetical protein
MTDRILKKHVFVMRDFDGKDINELELEMPSVVKTWTFRQYVCWLSWNLAVLKAQP